MRVEFLKRSSEILEEELKNWESAFLGKEEFWTEQAYLASLALRREPSIKIYALLRSNPLRTIIDIPLNDPTPQEILAREAYLGTTVFGEIDPEKYRAFATNVYTRDHLLALANRQTAGVKSEKVDEWFYTAFGVEHLKQYGGIYIGSTGGLGEYGHHFNVTIENKNRERGVKDTSITTAVDFAKVAQQSLPHITINPLPVDTYLQDMRSQLKFLPQDWPNVI